jgi:hypothetical protein
LDASNFKCLPIFSSELSVYTGEEKKGCKHGSADGSEERLSPIK